MTDTPHVSPASPADSALESSALEASSIEMAGATLPFHGYRIVALGVISHTLGVGLLSAYGFLVSPLIAEFGATPTQIGLGMSITIFSMAALAPVLGPILDRGRVRPVMLGGVALMLVSFLLLSTSTELWHLGLWLAIGSVGLSMYGTLPVKVMLINWFVRRRGTALAIAYTGMSLAGVTIPPLTAWLIEISSWRTAVTSLAIGAACIAAPAIAAFAVRRPEDIGQHPDGDPQPPAAGQEASLPESDVSSRELARDRNFWLVGIGESLALCVPVATGLFLVRHMEEVGIARAQIAFVIPLMSAFSLAGKLGVGALADRLDARMLSVATLVVHVVGLAIAALGTSLPAMLIAAVPLGLGGGGFIPLPGILQAMCFGRHIIGRVSGFHALMGLPFLVSSAPLVGMAAAAAGSFVMPFLTLGALQLVAAVILACVKPPAAAARPIESTG